MTKERLIDLAAFALAVLLPVAGCQPAATSPSPSVAPLPASPYESPAAFALQVIPEVSVGRTIGGQHEVFLVTITGLAAADAADVTAQASGATLSVQPARLSAGVVGEVDVVPAAVTSERTVEVTIRASAGGVERTAHRTLAMSPGTDQLRPEADLHLAPFLTWLASEDPELGITPDTPWTRTPGSWVLVVDHYLYFSEEWELGLQWHVMIAPNDWARIYLRHRWTETRPSLAFEISSFSGGTAPHEIAPPESVWR